MTRRGLAIASLVTVTAMLALAWLVGSSLPAGLQLPTHWNLAGEADRFSGKWPALLMPAAITAGLCALMFYLPAIEPRREGLERSRGLYLSAWAGLLLMGIAIEFVTIAAAFGWPVAGDRILIGATGILLTLIGNQLGKSRSMYLVGIRTPWTLASEEVWIKTHRLGGKLMVASGLSMVVMAMLPVPAAWRLGLPGIVLAAAVIVPIAYSYVLWRKEESGSRD